MKKTTWIRSIKAHHCSVYAEYVLLCAILNCYYGKDHGHLALKNAPAYFFTPYTKKYVLGPGLGDRSENWVKGQSVQFLQGLKHYVSITLDWGCLMSVIGHDSFLDHLGIVHAYQDIVILCMKYWYSAVKLYLQAERSYIAYIGLFRAVIVCGSCIDCL